MIFANIVVGDRFINLCRHKAEHREDCESTDETHRGVGEGNCDRIGEALMAAGIVAGQGQ